MNRAFFYFLILIAAIIFSYFFLNNRATIRSPNQSSTQIFNQLCQGNFSATVKRIIDGDTIVLNECSAHIRLSLANTPEVNEKGWSEATNFTASLCEVGSSVKIIQDQGQPYDVYGRMVAEVYCQNKNLNEELVLNNLAVIETQYCGRSIFSHESWALNSGCNEALGVK